MFQANMNKSRRICTLTAAAICVTAAGAADGQLVGDVMTANLLFGGSPAVSVTEPVLAGPEATGNWAGLLSYNLEDDNTITISSLQNAPATFWNNGIDFQFLDLDFIGFPTREIIGATVIAASGIDFEDISDGDLLWTAHSVTILGTQITNATPTSLDQSVTIQLITADIPAPAGAAIFGIAGLAMSRRRRS